MSFAGGLHFDGYSLGNVPSPSGTLVLTKRGRIEADIEVGTAIIDGSVTGNISASESVVLEGCPGQGTNIYPGPMRPGAILDGDCLFVIPEPDLETSADMALYRHIEFPAEDPLARELSDVLSDEPAEELEEFLLSA